MVNAFYHNVEIDKVTNTHIGCHNMEGISVTLTPEIKYFSRKKTVGQENVNKIIMKHGFLPLRLPP